MILRSPGGFPPYRWAGRRVAPCRRAAPWHVDLHGCGARWASSPWIFLARGFGAVRKSRKPFPISGPSSGPSVIMAFWPAGTGTLKSTISGRPLKPWNDPPSSLPPSEGRGGGGKGDQIGIPPRGEYSMLRKSASGPEIGVFRVGSEPDSNWESFKIGTPAGLRPAGGPMSRLSRFRPKSGPEARFPARKQYCAT